MCFKFLSPLSEQKAIVEKVNRLMSLCDALERHIEDNRQYAGQLMKSLMRKIV